MTENRGVVYFARFCQLIFSECVSEVEIAENDVIPCFKLHKRIFSDLTNKDNKKGDVGVLLLPEFVRQFQEDSQQQQIANAEAGPSVSPSQRSKKSKVRAVKSDRVNPLTAEAGVSNTDDMPQKKRLKKRRANRAKSDATNEESETDDETLHQRKRRLVAAHLFGAENISSTVAENFEVELQENEAVNMDRVSMENVAPVPTEDRVNADAGMMNFEKEAPTSKNDDVVEEDADHSDSRVFEKLDFFVGGDNPDAHPTISTCDTEDVEADQATLVIEDSVGSHTEVLSVNNANSEQGEEVDQSLEDAAKNVQEAADKLISEDIILEALQQSVVEVVTKETELMQTANSEIPEPVAEKVLDEAAQSNFETTSENVPAENTAENDNDDDSSDHSQEELSDSPANSDEQREVNRATAEHYQDMYYNRWAAADCIFSAQRAADFLGDSVKTISNPDILTSLKATVIQIKSLHNRFDESHKEVTALRNEVSLRDLTLKNDRAYYNSMFKKQAKAWES
ncbi:hypothetical protein POM88_013552 [Heracleum sosnowskyi]|uniref:Uncharacterized protein n=1 Tax=Heracleum sosnowskyi TaxID=360622 RepID=A0AAD8J1A0_9APIA|nr:hypothetical protein POM88_013552 [Heracleum sosnowskyi]